MTIKELSQYHNVKIEIQQIKDNIEEIETTIIGSSKIQVCRWCQVVIIATLLKE